MDAAGGFNRTSDRIHTRMEIIQFQAINGGDSFCGCRFTGLALCFLINRGCCIILDEAAEITAGGTPIGQEILGGSDHIEAPGVVIAG